MCVRGVCWGQRITLAIAPYELSTLLILLWLLSHGLSLGPGLTNYVGRPACEAVCTSPELGLQARVTMSSFLPCVLRTDSGSEICKTKTWLTEPSSQPSCLVLLHQCNIWPMTSSVPPHKQLPFSMPCLALCKLAETAAWQLQMLGCLSYTSQLLKRKIRFKCCCALEPQDVFDGWVDEFLYEQIKKWCMTQP